MSCQAKRSNGSMPWYKKRRLMPRQLQVYVKQVPVKPVHMNQMDPKVPNTVAVHVKQGIQFMGSKHCGTTPETWQFPAPVLQVS